MSQLDHNRHAIAPIPAKAATARLAWGMDAAPAVKVAIAAFVDCVGDVTALAVDCA